MGKVFDWTCSYADGLVVAAGGTILALAAYLLFGRCRFLAATTSLPRPPN